MDTNGIEYTTHDQQRPSHPTVPEPIAQARVAAAQAWQDYDEHLEAKPAQPDDEWINRLAELSVTALDAALAADKAYDEYWTAENRRRAAINIAQFSMQEV